MAKRKSLKDKLVDELIKLTNELDEEGINFLIDQANVLKYNNEVDRINADMEKRRALVGGNKKKSVTKSPAPQKKSVEINAASDKSSFIMQINNSRKILTREELRTMVAIAHRGEKAELFRWLKKERADILKDSAIKNKDDQTLSLIIELLVSSYKIKK